MSRRPALDRYLDRVAYGGPLEPSAATLVALHRAHLRAIPYENLDIHLGRRLRLGWEPAFERLVVRRRGGWCYEMNGLFAWVLGELGFRVRLLAGGVDRETLGDRSRGNHLVLLVELDRLWVADVGFGDGLLDPVPLVAGPFQQGLFSFRLEERGGRWILRVPRSGEGASFDFDTEGHQMEDFAPRCHELQTDPASGFVRKTVCIRHTHDGGLVTLRGAVLRTITARESTERVVESAWEYERVLREQFDLDLPEARALWPVVWQRHLAWKAGA
jgi:N-hydroxyarylamine O-acetyltransferase